VQAAEEAARLKSPITFNMVVLGAYIRVNPVVEYENVIKGLRKSLPERHHHLIPANEKEIQRGMEIVKEAKLTA
jgi:2-oxoglutarate ferredoxin oxidoreductase subunit gamma